MMERQNDEKASQLSDQLSRLKEVNNIEVSPRASSSRLCPFTLQA